MPTLSEHEVFLLVAQIGLILLAARIFSEFAKFLKLPVIVGEVVAGIVLGPMIFGNILPGVREYLFPTTIPQSYLLQGVSWLCVIFLLLITGLELNLRSALRQGKQSIFISFFDFSLSFVGTYCIALFLPQSFYTPGGNFTHANLFIALSLSMISIPVIAKILFDLKILQSDLGLKILISGVLSDIWGWVVMAAILSFLSGASLNPITVIKPLLIMFLYLVITLSVGHRLVDRFFDLVGLKNMDTTVLLSLLFSLALLNGALAHLLGIHVIFGAFIAGIMAGESKKITPYMRQWIQDFILGIFSPIFFAMIGMRLQFTQKETWIPLLTLLLISSSSKFLGAFLGGIVSGLGPKNSLTVASGVNTQGAMGIIVATVGYNMKILNDVAFTAIVVICITTSLSVGPLLKLALRGIRRPLAKFFDEEHVFLNVAGKNKTEVIENISKLMAKRKLIKDAAEVEEVIWQRERTLTTAIGGGVAVPHARIPNLKEPILCFFRLKNPVDFGSPDNIPVQLLFLELIDKKHDAMHLTLITQVARFVSSPENRNRLLNCTKEEEVHHIMSFDETA